MASHIERRKFLPTIGGAAAWPLAGLNEPLTKRFSEPKFGAIDRPVRATAAVVTCPAYFWSQVVPGK